MKRRKKFCIILSLCLICMNFDIGNGVMVQAQNSAGTAERKTLNFNTDWLYSSIDYENGEAVRLDDSGFDKVSVPHANTVLQSHKGENFPNEIASYRFISWYRRHFTLPEDYAGRNITVDFEGIATIADVYLNGELLTSHKGAYTGFSVDITDKAYTDGRENILAVRVNSERQPQIPPEGGNVDYCLFGGIVRDVTMTITEPVYVKRVFVTTPGLTKGSGKVKNSVDIQNNSGQTKRYLVETTVLDKDGKTVATASKQADIAAGQETNVEMTTDAVSNPHLWGSDDPYLYTAVTKIKDAETVIDTYNTKFGMRFIEFKDGTDGDASFYLNGAKTEILGINRHEQWPWIGRAVPDKLQRQDADLIKSSGINAVRCSHYPQDPSFLDRCDEIGLLVFAEPPGWQHIGNDEWKDNFKKNLEELILRDRNHPSIISWAPRPNESKTDLVFNRECDDLAKQLDPTRPTHGVRWEFALPGAANGNHLPDDDIVVNDILTVNYQYPQTPPFMPYIVTEHSNDWYKNNATGLADGMSWAPDNQMLSYIDSFAEPMDYYFRNDKVAGGFGWSMFDYNNEVNYPNTGYVFYSGLYDLFRHEKPVAYLYKSQKDPKEEVVIEIANNWTSATSKTVYVMSNCDEVELLVNGVSKGKISPNKYLNLPHPIYVFTGIDYEEGELKAIGYIDGKQVGECVRKTPKAAVRLVAKADYSVLSADGTDMTSVSVTAVDVNGNQVPFAANKINVTQTGGVKTTLISEKNVELENGKIAFLVQSVRDSVGSARFTAASEGVDSATVDIGIQPFQAGNLVPVVETTGSLSPAYPTNSIINDSKTGNGIHQYQYQGSGWVYGGEKQAYKNDNHYSKQAGDTVSIRFVGTNLKYYGTKAPAHGIAAIAVDGGEEKKVDCYAVNREDQTLLFDTGILEYGEHVLTVKVTGEKNGSATDCYVNADMAEISSKVPAHVVDDNTMGAGDLQFNYGGTWATSNDGSCYQGNNHWSNTAGSSLTFKFNGTSLKYYGTVSTNIGIAAFSIDGGEEQMADLYQANKEDRKLVYETGILTPGSHELKVRVTGNKNDAATDCCVVADKIEVYDRETICTHENTEIWNSVAQGCTKTGYTGDTYCLNCGTKITEGKVVSAAGHRWDKGVVTRQPTVAKTGIRTFTCNFCGAARVEIVEKLKTPKKGSTIKDKVSKASYQILTVKTSGGKVTGTVKYLKSTSASAKTVRVPSKITVNEAVFQVTSVADKAFRGNSRITNVVIGDNVTTIGNSAFYGCKKLKTVTLGKNVTIIGSSAFDKCAALTKITIPSGVKKIGKQAFSGCKKLKSITVKTTKLTKSSVGNKAFQGISSQAVIKVPRSKWKAYQSIFKMRGVGKKVKIKK